ncbi:cobyrinate a,c-diamide synthase [Alkalilimnicola ehrlichii MLHE-1]|uniref:Hydrogenobyrinic acid a,c-diamide synthase (Glutamine-hydrolysing) / cobyrinate a,c-diamide synthase n=1 Tax=Alkalilimnicola ehrlichii (strain ATCC BAA-1101 / DSM 17681 / MLHE-1) TaxID=187272 RepID=Q0A825_ALKEH|nr:cobyrinate a,c-diamide synthase [Alkalilimnicola ehrlichii]ABI57012.1 hydrogenobyrinic acid a,c-diamide synthase (glutamine-hydrolysing) / cobyrinate a,c-diamide synthase [Alkalilimnicola ehrlichii MLHE-1]
MVRLLLSATHKSSGKTAVAIGLAAALRRRGCRVQPFKKGPDYIDPGWLSLAAGRPCHGLDFHTMTREEILSTLHRRAANSDVVLVEGTKGLHDGVDPAGSDSNAALARLLDLPVVLVLDTRGMTRGVAPLVLGQQQMPGCPRIAGVILNRTGGSRHEAKLHQAMARHTDIPVLGAVGEDRSLAIEEPYLGLVPAHESADALPAVNRLAEAVAQNCDLPALAQACGTEPLPLAGFPTTEPPAARVRIGVPRDAAFGFYYPGDLEALQQAGAELVFFNALRDRDLPAVDGLFIGGGFPERHAPTLSANRGMREAIRQASERGMPIYAECGGLMYLSRSLSVGCARYAMCNALPVDLVMERRPQGRGYMQIQATGEGPFNPLADAQPAPAHEFHYSRLLTAPDGLRYAYRVLRGNGLGNGHDGIVHRNTLAAYAHLRHGQRTPWATRFVEFVVAHSRGQAPGPYTTAARQAGGQS